MGFHFQLGELFDIAFASECLGKKLMGTEATMVNKPGESHLCSRPISETCLPADLREVHMYFSLSFAESISALSKTWSDSCLLGRP